MRCETCGGSSFEPHAEATFDQDDTYIWSESLGKSRIHVKMVFTCMLCRQEYGGQWSGRIAVPIRRIKRQPFPDDILSQTREEFGKGWDLRHANKREPKPHRHPMPVIDGWHAANDWALDKKGRPPVRGGWRAVISDYMERETVWEYMRQLQINAVFAD